MRNLVKLTVSVIATILLSGCSSTVQENYQVRDGIIQADGVVENKIEYVEEEIIDSDVSVVEEVKEEVITNSLPSSEIDVSTTNASSISKVKEVKKEEGSIYFRFDEYQLSFDNKIDSSELSRIKKIIAKLNDQEKKTVSVEGNTDLAGADEYNYALGIKRANFIKNLIKVNTSIMEKDIKTVSYGENNPVCKESTIDCNYLNRRVEIK